MDGLQFLRGVHAEQVAGQVDVGDVDRIGLAAGQKLEEGLFPEGEASGRQVIVYFCNFNFLYDALTIDPRVGLFLPCRVTVVEQEGQVKVMSINPKRLSVLFNNERLDEACDEMHRIYTDILEEATF